MYTPVQRCHFDIGDVLDNQYIIEEELGEGACGKVFKVIDDAGHAYALKLMKLWEISPDVRQQFVARFDMEYETGRIGSHYIVHAVNHGIVKGNPYLVMEYITNRDLKKWMKRMKPDWIRIGKETLYGLKDLHSCGKVHRDLKPSNVLIRGDGTVALTDFGISGDRNKRLTEQNTQGVPQQIIGSYPYMPPEQLEPQAEATVLPTTDIFSFGVMMFELITGQLPFGVIENMSDLERYKRNVLEEKWDKKKIVESEFAPVIAGCLKADYKKRLQSADEVLKRMPHGDRETSYISGLPPVQMKAQNGYLLRIMQGEEYGKTYQLNALLHNGNRLITVGRQEAVVHNAIPIKESRSNYISRQHCTLEMELDTGEWFIRDGQWTGNRTETNNWKHSRNGTFVNSSEVTYEGMVLHPGDIISIGDVKLRVEGT